MQSSSINHKNPRALYGIKLHDDHKSDTIYIYVFKINATKINIILRNYGTLHTHGIDTWAATHEPRCNSVATSTLTLRDEGESKKSLTLMRDASIEHERILDATSYAIWGWGWLALIHIAESTCSITRASKSRQRHKGNMLQKSRLIKKRARHFEYWGLK